ncbi:hypothetical protein AURDEDRAFT_149630 [Auricularia subglabra TFB-10046 SS5]|nr:hypothetical protein AURDEDRAFT_149630 [Auricularia subglabra TFB-10046 SS5]
MLARRTVQHVCFMCAHFGRPFTVHAALSRPAPASTITPVSPTTNATGASSAPEGLAAEESSPSSSSTAKPKPKRPRKSRNAKAVDPDAPLPVLEPSASETFLQSLAATPQDPTLSDLDRFKPRSQPALTSSEYGNAWNAVVDNLCRSFTLKQVRKMAEEISDAQGVRIPATKIACARMIVEKTWGWRNPADIAKEQKQRTKLHARTYAIAPSELFLLLGRDGADLLRLSVELQVRVSVVPAADSMSIRVEGLLDALAKMEETLAETRKARYTLVPTLRRDAHAVPQNIFVEEIEDPSAGGLHQDLIQRVSKLTGAFIGILQPGKLRISAKRTADLEHAKRLVVRAAAIDQREANIPIFVHRARTPDLGAAFQRRYALYPFISPRTQLWTMAAGGALRARKVSEWLSGDDDYAEQYGLGLGETITFSGHEVDLRGELLAKLPDNGGTREIVASVGNILFTSRTAPAQRGSLSSPIDGTLTFSELLRWVSNTSTEYKSTFVPDLPAALLDSTPLNTVALNRLAYRAPETDTEPARAIMVDLGVPEMDLQSFEEQRVPEMDLGAASCRIGVEAAVDILLPDRPMDIRFSIFNFEETTLDGAPPALIEYAHALKAYFADPSAGQPIAPLQITHDGAQYTLDTSWSVRRSRDEFTPPRGHDWAMDGPTRAVTESMSDLEGNQKAASCEIVCEDAQKGWKEFLRHCDRLTMKLPRSVPSLEESMVEEIDSLAL